MLIFIVGIQGKLIWKNRIYCICCMFFFFFNLLVGLLVEIIVVGVKVKVVLFIGRVDWVG